MTDGNQPQQESWRLDHFLKFTAIAETGGHAKLMIQAGEVTVNGVVETRRRRQLVAGDVIQIDGVEFLLDDYIPDHGKPG